MVSNSIESEYAAFVFESVEICEKYRSRMEVNTKQMKMVSFNIAIKMMNLMELEFEAKWNVCLGKV